MARKKRMLVAFCGGDGTGKSTQAAFLAERLCEAGMPAVVVWNRWEPRLIGLVVRSARWLSEWRNPSGSEKQSADQVAHAVSQRPFIARAFSQLSWLEYLIQTRWRLLRRSRSAHVVILDRYVVDMAVDRARRLGWSDGYMADQIERAHRRGFPRPVLNNFFTAPASVLVKRRPEERFQVLQERSAIYKRVAELLEAPIVDAGDSIPAVAERVWDILQSCVATDDVAAG